MVDKELLAEKLRLLSEYITDLEEQKKMAQFRNVIVHDYARIEPEILYAVLQKNIKNLRLFARTIRNHLLQE